MGAHHGGADTVSTTTQRPAEAQQGFFSLVGASSGDPSGDLAPRRYSTPSSLHRKVRDASEEVNTASKPPRASSYDPDMARYQEAAATEATLNLNGAMHQEQS